MPLGNPIYTYGDEVEFDVFLSRDAPIPTTLRGTVAVVDANGTFGQSDYASYDIMVEDFGDAGCLFKHIIEPEIRSPQA